MREENAILQVLIVCQMSLLHSHIKEVYVYFVKPVVFGGSFSLACFFWKI